jgi:hypothetical protein
MLSGQLILLGSRQSQKLGRMLGAGHQATSRHQLVSAFTAMGLVPFLGEDNVLYMWVDRGREPTVRSRGGHDLESLEFGRGGGRRICLPIQSNFGHHCSSSSIDSCEVAMSSKSRVKQEVLLNLAVNQLLFENLNKLCLSPLFPSVSRFFP